MSSLIFASCVAPSDVPPGDLESEPSAVPPADPRDSDSLDVSDSTAPECTICLGSGELEIKMMLSCGHVFCRNCISQHVLTNQRNGRVASCPNCNASLLRNELLVCVPEEEVDQLIADSVARVAVTDCQQSAATGPPVPPLGEAARFLRQCPSCNATIEKNGGCDHMTCRCGHHFSWNRSDCIGPCTCIKPHPGIPRCLEKYSRLDVMWGTTCKNCTWGTAAILRARRTGVVVGAVVIVMGVLIIVPLSMLKDGLSKVDECITRKVPNFYAYNPFCGFLGLGNQITADILRARKREAEKKAELELAVKRAERVLQAEEGKWFNYKCIQEAKQSLDVKRLALRNALGNDLISI